MVEIDYNIFKRDIKDYSICLNPVKQYLEQAVTYYSKMKGVSRETAISEVKQKVRVHNTNNPDVVFRHRKANGDVFKNKMKLTEYIQDTLDNGEIIAPSFTTYIHPRYQESLHAKYLKNNVKLRSEDKKAAFAAKLANDMTRFNRFNTLQKTRKVKNNALSGAYGAGSTIIANVSAHYTLTSITRCVSSIGNAITESIVGGNKNFKTVEAVLNYITAIITYMNKADVEYSMFKYSLYVPTVDNLIQMFKRSTDNYWRNEKDYQDVRAYLERLNDAEKCAVMYTNDLYHMRIYNDALLRDMIGSLAKKVTDSTNDLTYMKKAPEGVDILVKMIWYEELRGKSIKLDDIQDTPLGNGLASTAQHVMEVLGKYKKLIHTFFVTDILPMDIATIKETIRACIVLSDTDSTCGAYDDWVEWYFGGLRFDQEAIGVSAAVTMFNIQCMDHNIKIFARNMNIPEDRVELLKMKNEFFWPVFIPANINKHYYALSTVQEGNVFEKGDIEIKGVNLIASKANEEIVTLTHRRMDEVTRAIANGEKINISKYIKEVVDLENQIIDYIESGHVDMFSMGKMKPAASYKKGEIESPYFYHLLWNEVFAQKYGNSPEPTYMMVKLPTILSSKKIMDDFLQKIKDENLKARLIAFLEKNDKTCLPTLQLPLDIVVNKGIPEEFKGNINMERVILDNLTAYYMFLETLGVYKKENYLMRDIYTVKVSDDGE